MSALWLGVLAHLWQTTLVLLVLGALALLLRRAPARYQEWLWTAALVKLLVPLPLVALFWPAFTRLGYAVGQQETIGPAIKTLSLLANPRVLWLPPVDATGADSLQPMLAAATIGWGLGAVALLMFWCKRGRVSVPAGRMPWHGSAKVVERVTRAAREANVPLNRVRITEATVVPCVRNLWRPLVVVSTAVVENLSREELRAVLVHEDAHRRRGDLWRGAAHSLATCLFFFYPPAWWLKRRLQRSAELACDEAVLAAGIDGLTYSKALAATVSLGLAPPVATALIGRSSVLRERLERIRAPERYRIMNRHRFAVLAGFVAAVTISFIPVADGGRSVAAAGEPQQGGQWLPASDIVGLNGIATLVEMRYRDVPLSFVFEQLGERVGFSVQFEGDGSFTERTSVGFARLSVRDVLELLARDASIEYRVPDARTLVVRMWAPVTGREQRKVVRRFPSRLGADMLAELLENEGERNVAIAQPPEGPPYRVGGVINEPEKIYHVNPEYPELARRARLDGFIVLEAVLSKEGTIKDVSVLRGLGLGLDQAAVDAVTQWRYTPTLYNGEPVEVVLTVTVVFQLIQ